VHASIQTTALQCLTRAALAALAAGALLSACGGASGAKDESAHVKPSAATAQNVWKVAAAESERFTVSGTRLTRYGIEGNWVEMWVTDATVDCSNATYGDPVSGTVKECQIADAGQWQNVAVERGSFSVVGAQRTRYGKEGVWTEKTFVDTTVSCSNATYGDPLVGTVKECQVYVGVAPVAGATITVQAAGEECEGRADLALLIRGSEVTRWRGVLGSARDAAPQYHKLSYQHPDKFLLADVEVAFVNDHWTPTCNRNIRVATVEVTQADGALERVELAKQTVRSTGTWSTADKCAEKDVQSEWLDCNGGFRFASVQPQPQTPPPETSADMLQSVYETDGSKLLNPERGFHQNTSMVTSTLWGAAGSEDTYAAVRQAGHTLVRGIALFDKHRDGPLPDSALSELRQGFAHARKHGIKVWFLAAYNFPSGAGSENDTTQTLDPELEVVLNHLDQLKPVFEENKDVLAGMYNGFIGAWGEWHSSNTGLHLDPKRRQIWEKILASVPADRMMTVRQFEAMDTLVDVPPTKDSAYDATAGSRTGMTNQCYLVNYTDAGTFVDSNSVPQQKALLAQWTQFVPFVAEVCEVSYREGNRNDCASAKAENEMLHLTALNATFYQPTLDAWKSEGCYDEIDNRMGYRFELARSSVQRQVQSGSPLQMSFVVKNVGYAAPFNPRALSVVLRNQSTGERYDMSILQSRSSTLDPRTWYRESGEITVSAAPTVPSGVPAGAYDVLLSLHDPVPGLATRPEYSIRLANKGVWESATGLNKLVGGVTVTAQ
jgi:hypothetical protein